MQKLTKSVVGRFKVKDHLTNLTFIQFVRSSHLTERFQPFLNFVLAFEIAWHQRQSIHRVEQFTQIRLQLDEEECEFQLTD